MDEFRRFHPTVNFIYFAVTMVFSVVFMHPICLFISLFTASLHLVMQKGFRALKSLSFMLFAALFAALINTAFNHAGATILAYFPSGNPLTKESLVYGIAAAVMIFGVFARFSCFNAVMTSEKFVYLFSRLTPSLSLVLSMTLRFAPRFAAKFREVAQVQRFFGNDVYHGSIFSRSRAAVKIVSVMLTYSLENSVETADSMNSRGYGAARRSSFSTYKFSRRDGAAMSVILFSAVYIIVRASRGALHFAYFPAIGGRFSPDVFFMYLVLFSVPIFIETAEVIRWRSLKSKI